MKNTNKDKIWSIKIPIEGQFADAISLYVEPKEIICEVCEDTASPPLLLEWDDGSEILGDFVFALYGLVSKISILKELQEQFKGFIIRPIEFHDHPNLYNKTGKKRTKRIWLPYEGPELGELFIVKEINLHKSSTVIYEEGSECPACGIKVIDTYEGVEEKNSRIHTPRIKGKGFFVKRTDIDGYDFFKPKGIGFNLCTNGAKEFLEGNKCTNIDFLEMGEVI